MNLFTNWMTIAVQGYISLTVYLLNIYFEKSQYKVCKFLIMYNTRFMQYHEKEFRHTTILTLHNAIFQCCYIIFIHMQLYGTSVQQTHAEREDGSWRVKKMTELLGEASQNAWLWAAFFTLIWDLVLKNYMLSKAIHPKRECILVSKTCQASKFVHSRYGVSPMSRV